MKYELLLIIDPGASGCIIKYRRGMFPEALKMPKSNDLIVFFTEIKQLGLKTLVCIEKVQMRKDDVDSPGKIFGIEKMVKHFTELITITKMSGFDYVLVHPMTWQSYLKLKIKGLKETKGERKNRYKRMAVLQYPTQVITLWNADGFMLTTFILQKFKYDNEWIEENIIKN